MYEIREFSDRDQWSRFVAAAQPPTFLQDWEWGEVEAALGREVIRVGIYHGETLIGASPDQRMLIGVCQLVGYRARRGNFLLIPHGPVLRVKPEPAIFIALTTFLRQQGYHRRYAFIRLNSALPKDLALATALRREGFHFSPLWTVADNAWVIDLDPTEEQILASMQPSHRKAITDGLKKPFLEIEATTDSTRIGDFWPIYQQLAQRKEFMPYPRDLVEREFAAFAAAGKAKLYLGRVEGRYACGAIIIFSNGSAFYHHGASLPLREPLTYKLHWQGMRDAKAAGCQRYNLWGITLSQSPKHPWAGLTQFKKGFGGGLIEFLSTMDFVCSQKYWLTYLVERARRQMRRL